MKSKTLFYLILLTLLTLLISVAHAQTFSVIYSFANHADGSDPTAGVTIRGNALYGTTAQTGAVYQLTHSGSNWRFTTLAPFPSWPQYASRAVFGPDGHIYTTTLDGGANDQSGAVFKLTPPVGICRTVACYWTVNDLHDFGSGTDGQNPYMGDLIWDQQGNIYGTTLLGGTSGVGIVYELTPSGNGYTENVIYSFSGSDGAYPAALTFDKKGNLYGTAIIGGPHNSGNVFELSYVPGVGWTEQVLYEFQNAGDGASPVGGLIFDSSGNLYGTTHLGGRGGGTVFELSPSGNMWTFKLLYSFPAGDGPRAALSMDGAGNLYGTTYTGGLYYNGNVFKLSNTQDGWVYTSLHDFTGGTDGRYCESNVSIDTDGTLYGTTYWGGDYGYGVVWMIKP